MKRARLYLLGALGALLNTAGDVAGVVAARGGGRAWVMHMLGALAWASCYPVWYAMTRAEGGAFTGPAAAWDVGVCVLFALVALASGEAHTRSQWAGFALILVGAALWEVGR